MVPVWFAVRYVSLVWVGFVCVGLVWVWWVWLLVDLCSRRWLCFLRPKENSDQPFLEQRADGRKVLGNKLVLEN